MLLILQETTLFLQMLYNLKFKQQYSEELMTHYQTMIESVVDRNIREHPYDPLVKQFKALDSSLERGMLTSTGIASCGLLHISMTVAYDSLCIGCFDNSDCALYLLQLWCNFLMFPIWS